MRRLKVMAGLVLATVVMIPLTFGLTGFADVLLNLLPRVAYRLRAVSAPSVCNQIKRGMTKPAALQVLSHTAEPSFALMSADQLEFSAEHFTCTVQFEPSSGLVGEVHAVKKAAGHFDDWSTERWPESSSGR